ncbi:hypothetical protein EDB19DRAFT_1832657 [Suillus lakei]|nr:hypothetical protein EDB19DRAFT_1832657 [Suillus lakei]
MTNTELPNQNQRGFHLYQMDLHVVVDSTTSEKYLRIASISIAFYEYILTLPAEWRFYRSQSSIFHPSLSCVLFILIRGQQLRILLDQLHPTKRVNNIILLHLSSKVILGVRTFNVAKRDRRIGIVLLLIYFFLVSVEWFTDMFARTPVVINGNCTPADAGKVLSTWFFYLTAMLFDIVMVAVSTTHLLRYNPMSSRVERLIRVLIYDGIGYFIILSGKVKRVESHPLSYDRFRDAARLCWLVLVISRQGYSDCSERIIRASIGYAVTWIMSQRILIHIQEMREPDDQHLENVVIARPTPTAQKKLSGLRSYFESKTRSKSPKSSESPFDVEFAHTSPRNRHPNDMELGVRVCVERSVVVDYIDGSERSSSCETPRVK